VTFNTKYQVYHVAFAENNIKNFLLFSDLLELAKKGVINQQTYIWKKGLRTWITAGKIPELKPLFWLPPEVPKELREEY